MAGTECRAGRFQKLNSEYAPKLIALRRLHNPFPYFPTTMGARYQPSLGEVGLDLVRVSSLASADDFPGGRHVR
jgi:hypothetical protein